MSIKLICSDIDGTLLQYGRKELEGEIFEQIRELHRRGILFCPASGAKSLRRLVYCRPDAGQNKIPRRCSSRICSKISSSSFFLPYCSSVPSMSLQISLIDIFRPHFSR